MASAQRAFEIVAQELAHGAQPDPAQGRRVDARARAALIARNLTLDQGKPLAEALAEVKPAPITPTGTPRNAAASMAGSSRHDCPTSGNWWCTSRSAFAPHSRRGIFRSSQAIRKICAAIGAGCTIILKGPEDAPSAILALGHLFEEMRACLEDASTSSGSVPSEVSEYLIRSPHRAQDFVHRLGSRRQAVGGPGGAST